VLELLEAGINVMTAINIQHLETLNDAVNRSANTIIRETVPTISSSGPTKWSTWM